MLFLLNPMTAVYVVAALIPAIVLLCYVYRHDKIEKEPPKLLGLMLLGGVLATLVALVLETVGQSILNRFFYYATPLYYILLAFIVVACVEEGGKLLFLKLFTAPLQMLSPQRMMPHRKRNPLVPAAAASLAQKQ